MTQRIIKIPKEYYLTALNIQKFYMKEHGVKYPLYKCLLLYNKENNNDKKNFRFRL